MQLERGMDGRAVLSEAFQREARLVRDLTEALPVEARTIFFRQLDDLLGLIAEPKCAEYQADGVPCPVVGVSCELCGRATQWVHDLREAIARSST